MAENHARLEPPWKLALEARRERLSAELGAQRIDAAAFWGAQNQGKTWSHHARDVIVQRFFGVLEARMADIKAGRPGEATALDERIRELQLERVELDRKQEEGR